jgi:hypothetical protein
LPAAAETQAEISQRITAIWTSQTGQPLHIVAGDDWIASLVGVSAPDRPSLLSKGDHALSPWINAERLRREGMLIVWDAGRPRIPQPLSTLVAERTRAVEHFTWPGPEGEKPLSEEQVREKMTDGWIEVQIARERP